MKRIPTSLALLVTMVMGASAASYKIWIGGEQITDSNKNKVTSNTSGTTISGTISYNPSTKVLTLDNATVTVSGDHHGISMEESGVTIQCKGTNNFTLTTSKTNNAIRMENASMTMTLQGIGTGASLNLSSKSASGLHILRNRGVLLSNTYYQQLHGDI